MRLKNAIHASTYIRGYPMLTLYIADVERDVGMKKLSQEEAAKVLEGMKVKSKIPKAAVTQWKRNTALDMAIEALKYSEIPNSSDTISRQDVCDWLNEMEKYGRKEDAHGYHNACAYIAQLPSAEPRKKGKWLRSGSAIFPCECDQCGDTTERNTPFCPHCGADMRDSFTIPTEIIESVIGYDD